MSGSSWLLFEATLLLEATEDSLKSLMTSRVAATWWGILDDVTGEGVLDLPLPYPPIIPSPKSSEKRKTKQKLQSMLFGEKSEI